MPELDSNIEGDLTHTFRGRGRFLLIYYLRLKGWPYVVASWDRRSSIVYLELHSYLDVQQKLTLTPWSLFPMNIQLNQCHNSCIGTQ